MADKDRALELARSYNPAEFKMRPIGDIYSDARRAIAEKYNAFMGHPVVQAFGEEPLEMTKAMGEAGVELAKMAPDAARAAANYVYENPSKSAGHALEFGAGLITKTPAMVAWGPGGVLSPSEAKASELDPQSAAAEHARQQILNQEAQMMREGYAGGYAEGGEVREAHADGRKAVGPLAKAAESAMTKAAEKVLAEKMAERAARYVEDPDVRAANLAKFMEGNNPNVPPAVFHASKADVTSFDPAYKTELSPFGFHFGTADQANFRTGQYDFESGMPNVGKYHLSLKKPLEVTHMGSYAPDHLADQMMDMGILKPERYEALVDKHMYDPVPLGSDLVKILKKNGYDGLMYQNEKEGAGFSFVPFDAFQSKSATGNLGTFDPAIPRLTEAKGGEIREAHGDGLKVMAPMIAKGESLMTKLAKEALQRRGAQAAQRVERAADEIPNLEYQYTPDALREALLAKDSLVATIKPGEFQNFAHRLPNASENFYTLPADPNKLVSREEYIKHLSQFPVAGGGGFSDVPYLVYGNLRDDPLKSVLYGEKKAAVPLITGHEGRHRMLALEQLEEPSSLVRIFPEIRIKDELKDRLTANNSGRNVYDNDLLNTALKSQIQHSGPVVGEGRSLDKFNMLDMPEVYERGGKAG